MTFFRRPILIITLLGLCILSTGCSESWPAPGERSYLSVVEPPYAIDDPELRAADITADRAHFVIRGYKCSDKALTDSGDVRTLCKNGDDFYWYTVRNNYEIKDNRTPCQVGFSGSMVLGAAVSAEDRDALFAMSFGAVKFYQYGVNEAIIDTKRVRRRGWLMKSHYEYSRDARVCRIGDRRVVDVKYPASSATEARHESIYIRGAELLLSSI